MAFDECFIKALAARAVLQPCKCRTRRAENYAQWITLTCENNGKYKVKDQEMFYKNVSTRGLRNRADGRL